MPNNKDKEISIHIEKDMHKVTSPIPGAELYALAKLPSDYELYLEVPGPGDDELIPNDDTPIEVKPGAHFYGAQRTLNPGKL